MTPEDQARDMVVGAALSPGRFAAYAIGIGFLGVVFAFVPLFGIIMGIVMVLGAWKWAKKGTTKLLGFLLGAVAIAASFAAMLWGEATQTQATTDQFTAQGGVWSLFVPGLMTMDLLNQPLFGKTATTTWATQQAWGATPTAAPASLPPDYSGGGQAI